MLRKMSPKVDADRTLDCIGLYCPEPVFRTRIELDKMDSNQVLEVIADDPAAEEDVKSLVKRIGHELLRIDKQDRIIHFFIRKKD
jgi:TusA-related sulfurtransferase